MMLKGLRALDLTNENGFLCGQMLADLGVDVIKVEPPGGDQSRKIGPFWSDNKEPEKSLYWFAYNSNKRGITLDIASERGQDIFIRLVKNVDFIIESFAPGYLDKLGLGYAALSAIKADIIMTSITPFGQHGPYKDYLATDIVIMGMSGILYQTGDADRPPVHMSLPQACMHAGADAAVGTMMAYYHRKKTGEGQQVDISMQQSTAWFLANAIPLWEMNGIISKRAGALRWSMNSTQRQVWPCLDGYVFFNIIGGRTGAKTLQELVNWMDSRGMADDYLRAMDWETLDMFKVGQDVVDRISRPIEAFFLANSKEDIAAGAAERRISICPLSSMEDLYNNPQLDYRKFWAEVEYPELESSITMPRTFIKSSESEGSNRVRAPLIGEHNQDVYMEAGFTKYELTHLKQDGII